MAEGTFINDRILEDEQVVQLARDAGGNMITLSRKNGEYSSVVFQRRDSNLRTIETKEFTGPANFHTIYLGDQVFFLAH